MKSKTAHLAIVIGIIILVMSLSYFLMGLIPMTVFSIFLIGGLFMWLKTTYHYQVNPNKIIIPYLLTVIFFIIHVLEEYLTSFHQEMSDLSGFHIPEANFLIIAAFGGPILWLTGAVLLLRKNPVGYYITWGFFIAMIFSELAHFVFPFMKEGRFTYFSGMYTAILPLIPAFYAMRMIIKDTRSRKSK